MRVEYVYTYYQCGEIENISPIGLWLGIWHLYTYTHILLCFKVLITDETVVSIVKI